jgi:Acyl-CoA carboxylase epsilon subunit
MTVRGNPTAEELAAVLTVLCTGGNGARPADAYERWRGRRLSALRSPRTTR